MPRGGRVSAWCSCEGAAQPPGPAKAAPAVQVSRAGWGAGQATACTRAGTPCQRKHLQQGAQQASWERG